MIKLGFIPNEDNGRTHDDVRFYFIPNLVCKNFIAYTSCITMICDYNITVYYASRVALHVRKRAYEKNKVLTISEHRLYYRYKKETDMEKNYDEIRDLLSNLEEDLGEICLVNEKVSGIYYLTARQDGEPFAGEYYAVTDTPIISRQVRAYGRRISDLWLFSMQDDASGWRIIDYELGKYRVKNHLPQEQTLHDIALDAAEYHPEYFGAYPIPLHTPRGYTTRHWTLANGIYWLETDQCEEVLAVCYPLWTAELSTLAERVGEMTEYDKAQGIHQNLGCIFFPAQFSCIPIYELMQTRMEAWSGTVIDKPALMNAIWRDAPEYAIMMNRQEQTGMNDLPTMLLGDFGIEAGPQILPDRMIAISADAGVDYLLFRR